MTELILVGVLACVYVSDAVWWTTEHCLILVGSRIGEFRAQYGPLLRVREGQGFFTSTLVPPFRHAFEFQLYRTSEGGGKPSKRAAVERAVTQVLTVATPLRRVGEWLWVYLFIVVPVAVAILGLARTWLALLAGLLLWLIAIVVMYRRAWRALHDENPSGWKSDAALMILSPPGAIRAADRLTRKALQRFSGLRVASIVVSHDELCRLARIVYFDEPAANDAAARHEIEQILGAKSLDALVADPPTRESGMKGFCPRCHGQVLRDSGDCPDCVGVTIRSFEPHTNSAF
jgi:hypothetical protein